MLLALLPKRVLHPSAVGQFDIALAGPAVSLYSLILFPVAAWFTVRGLIWGYRVNYPGAGWIFLGAMAMTPIIWSAAGFELAGALQFVEGAAAWIVGAGLGQKAVRERRALQIVAMTILGVITLQAVIATLQRLGLPINAMDPDLAEIMGSRVNGSLNHPNNLGKVLLLLTILSLGLMAARDRGTRTMLWAAIAIGLVPMALTQGRANLLAVLSLVVFWSLLSPRGSSYAVRIGVPLVALAVVAPFISAVLTRLQDDPDGGARPELTTVAFEQIALRPVWGTGPNSYVVDVAPFDFFVAQGYPVHNTFLLSVAELGVLVAAAFWFPVALVYWHSWRSRRSAGFEGSFGLALTASVPGMYVVMSTGWSILSSSLLPLWFLVLGLAYSFVRPTPWYARSTGYAK